VKNLSLTAICAALLLGACSNVTLVDEITIVNETEYPANVNVTGKDRGGWLGLTMVEERSTRAVGDVIDQGEVWIFRFDYGGKHQEEVEVSRNELVRNDWTVEVPESFGQRLRELGLTPPP
jgi:hypothetical protein